METRPHPNKQLHASLVLVLICFVNSLMTKADVIQLTTAGTGGNRLN